MGFAREASSIPGRKRRRVLRGQPGRQKSINTLVKVDIHHGRRLRKTPERGQGKVVLMKQDQYWMASTLERSSG